MWIALPKPLVAEKSVVSITDQREYILKEQKEDFVAGWLAPIKVVCPGTTATFHICSIQMGPGSDSSQDIILYMHILKELKSTTTKSVHNQSGLPEDSPPLGDTVFK